MTGTAERRTIGDAEGALKKMPEVFRNRDFREEMGMLPFPASQMLSMLQTLGLIEHAGNIQLWRVVASERESVIPARRESAVASEHEIPLIRKYSY